MAGELVQRTLIIDESLTNRLRTELCNRGREAHYIKEDALNLGGYKDDDLIAALAEAFPVESIILVTAENAMPGDHAEMLAEKGLLVATVDPDIRRDYSATPGDGKKTQEEWKRETVHRWAHRMSETAKGDVRRYSPYGHRLWKPRS